MVESMIDNIGDALSTADDPAAVASGMSDYSTAVVWRQLMIPQLQPQVCLGTADDLAHVSAHRADDPTAV